MKRTIYIFSEGELKRKQNTLYFEGAEGKKKYVPIENTGEIYIFGQVTLNKKLLELLTKAQIVLHFFNYHGYYVGSYYPREYYNSGYMILKQAEFYLEDEKRLDLAKRFVRGGVANMERVLAYYHNRGIPLDTSLGMIKDLRKEIDTQNKISELMAIEGNIREAYYKAFGVILKNGDFEFQKRTKRPPENRLNAMISLGNSVIYTVVLSEIYKTHLDPRIGFLHATNFRRFTLNLDVAEIFKPIIVDRVIFYLLNKGMIKGSDFRDDLNGIYMKENANKVFIGELDKRLGTTIEHKALGRKVSYRRLIRLELYKLEKHLMDEKAYQPFVARW